MHRFFLLDTSLHVYHSVDLAPIAHQLRNVLRLQPGAQIILLDGCGAAYCTEIQSLERRAAVGIVLEQQAVTTEPMVQLTLYLASLKADKFEWVLQKGTELGVARFVPVISARSIVRPASALTKKYDRWRQIIREAAEQSGRARLPELLPPMAWRAAVSHAAGLRWLPWEESAHGGISFGLGQVVQAASAIRPAPTSANLLIGPEGGISSAEVEEALAAGWRAVSLGPRILRAETAALAAITIVLERLEQFAVHAQDAQPHPPSVTPE